MENPDVNSLNALDPEIQNRDLHKVVTSYISSHFPIASANKTLDLIDIKVDNEAAPDFDLPLQKEVKNSGRTWAIPIYGTFVLKDESGGVIDKKVQMKIMNLPKVTQRFSMIIDGNEYQTTNQLRLKSGIYSRIKNNGDFESQFNLAKGFNFKLILNPVKGIFQVLVGTQSFSLYSLLKAFDIEDSVIREAWGRDLFNKNSAMGVNTREWINLVEKVKYVRPKTPEAAKAELIKYFSETQVDPETTLITLGKEFSSVQGDTWLTASKKLLRVQRGESAPDERDSLVFKELMTVNDLLDFYLKKQKSTIQNTLRFRMEKKNDIREIISSNTFGKTIKSFFTTGDLSSVPPQTNPASILSEWRKTTVMGSGGIPDIHSVTMESRNVHPSQMGFLDPVNTPESNKVGISMPLSIYTRKDYGKNMSTPILLKSGKIEYMSPGEMWEKQIGFSSQYKLNEFEKPLSYSNQIIATYRGEQIEASKENIYGYFLKPQGLFSWTTNLMPFLAHTQGNRALVGSKMVTQAFAIDENEAPLVQTKMPLLPKTFEQAIGRFLNPYVPDGIKSATISKITNDYITLKTGARELVKIGLYNQFPLNQESFLQSTPLVKVGDKVKEGDELAKNNFEGLGIDGEKAFGVGANVTVGYFPYKGLNFEDGIVVTDSASRKFSHTIFHRFSALRTTKGEYNKDKLLVEYPYMFSNMGAYAKLDQNGIVLPGTKVKKGDVLIAHVEPRVLTTEQKILGNMNRSISRLYSNKAVTYDFDEPGEVIYVNTLGRKIDIKVKTTHPLVEGDKLCVSDDTEMLTSKGWKNIDDVTDETEFCTLSPDTGQIEYQKPSVINRYFYEGGLIEIDTHEVSQLVTLNHNIYCKLHGFKEFKLIPSQDAMAEEVLYSKCGSWGGDTDIVPTELQTYFTGPEYASLLGWFFGCGNVSDGEVRIHSPNSKDVVEILERSGRHYDIYPDRVVIRSRSLASYFEDLKKQIPSNLKNASSDLIRLFLVTFSNAQDSNNFTIHTAEDALRDDLQELALKAGWCADCELSKSKYMPWIIHIYTNDVPYYRYGTSVLRFKGRVWCPTTKNGIVYARRNGKVCWTGNSNRYGGKGVVVKIISDEESPHTESGKRIDVILSPFGIPSRMTPSQILETSAAKIAEKTGKPYIVENFDGKDNLRQIVQDLKKHEIETDEVVLDKKNGKPLKNKVLVGPQYFMKLMHVIEHKEKSRGFGTYNINEAPGRGESGGQSIDPLTNYSLLAHGARWNLKEFTALKGQRNDEFWRALQLGEPLPAPEKLFVFDKMMTYLRGAGIDSVKKGNIIQLLPLTDQKVDEISHGKLTNAGHMLKGKNLDVIEGGIFDKKITGGEGGRNYAHIELSERFPSPIFEKAISSILGITSVEYQKYINTNIPGLLEELDKVDVNTELNKAKKDLQSAPDSLVNKYNKKIRFLRTLEDNALTPAQAYTIRKIPVIPPIYRPIYALPSGDLMTSPINNHYRAVFLISSGLESDKELVTSDKLNEIRKELYNNIKELQGLTDLTHFGKEKYEGLLKTLAGKTPGEGFVHNNVWTKRQDLSARSTITLEPSLGVDEIGLPVSISKDIFGPFAVNKLVSIGYSPIDAKKEIEEETEIGIRGIDLAMEDRPVLINRAPSLHKHSIQAVRAKRMAGRSIKLNPLIAKAHNFDFDGDTMSVFTPVTEKAIQEAYSMLPSKNLYQYGPPINEPIMPIVDSFSQIYQQGLWYLSKIEGIYGGGKFRSIKDAAKALADGVIDENDEIELEGIGKTSYGKELILSVLPQDMRDRGLVFDHKTLQKVMREVAKRYPAQFEQIINAFKELGNSYSFVKPISLSIKDLDIDRRDRDLILKRAHEAAKLIKDPYKKAKIYSDATLQAQEATYTKARKNKNRFFDMIDSGAQGKPDAIRQTLVMPGVVLDLKGRPISIPVEKSWTEGVPDYGYWNHMYGARKGTVDVAISTQDSGALNKALLTNLKDLLITMEDCGTDKGIDIEANSKDVLGRVVQETIDDVIEKGEAIGIEEGALLAEKLGYKKILVRSPLTCEAPHGICTKCYGLGPDGRFPRIGENVGILDGAAITERSTQLALRSKHMGGAALATEGISEGFPELSRSLEMPATLPGKATLSRVTGRVDKIKKNPAGGHEIIVSSISHIILPGRNPVVKEGDRVIKGQVLSTGTEKPQEVAELRGFLDAQRSLVNRMNNVYDNKFAKRTFETVVRGISNNAYITSALEDSEFLRGDTAKISVVELANKDRIAKGLAPIEYKPYFKSIQVLPHERDDWLSRMTSNNIKKTIQEAVGTGLKTNIHGYDPHPAYLYGSEFAEEFDPKKGVFW